MRFLINDNVVAHLLVSFCLRKLMDSFFLRYIMISWQHASECVPDAFKEITSSFLIYVTDCSVPKRCVM